MQGFTTHTTACRPVSACAVVTVLSESGEQTTDRADAIHWQHCEEPDGNVVAYRVETLPACMSC